MPTKMSREEFDRFYRAEVGPLYRFILVRVGSKEVAEDISSATFSRLLERMFAESIYNPRGYLYQIARNAIADHFKFAGRTVPIADEEHGWDEQAQGSQHAINRVSVVQSAQDLESLVSSSVARSQVKDILRACTEEERALLELRYAEGLDWTSVAHRMGKSVVAVRVSHHRVLKKLRKLFDEKK